MNTNHYHMQLLRNGLSNITCLIQDKHSLISQLVEEINTLDKEKALIEQKILKYLEVYKEH